MPWNKDLVIQTTNSFMKILHLEQFLSLRFFGWILSTELTMMLQECCLRVSFPLDAFLFFFWRGHFSTIALIGGNLLLCLFVFCLFEKIHFTTGKKIEGEKLIIYSHRFIHLIKS